MRLSQMMGSSPVYYFFKAPDFGVNLMGLSYRSEGAAPSGTAAQR